METHKRDDDDADATGRADDGSAVASWWSRTSTKSKVGIALVLILCVAIPALNPFGLYPDDDSDGRGVVGHERSLPPRPGLSA